jgi:hypothetical protein
MNVARPPLAPIPVRSEPIAAEIARLEALMARMEGQYGIGTAAMACDVAGGRHPETVEVGDWLVKYHLLTRLRAARLAGHVTG